MLNGEGRKPSLQEAAIKGGVVGYDEHDPPEQIVDGSIIDPGAARQALLAQKAQELDRFARVRGELDSAVRATRDARAVSP